MDMVLNEVKLARQTIEDGKVGEKASATLFLLAKYYRQKEGLPPRDTEARLHEFMRLYYKNYNQALWEALVEQIAKKAVRYPIREVDYIGITRPELDCIALLDNPKYERLLFVMLCYAKLYNTVSEKNNSWVNADVKDIFRLARVTVKHRNDKWLYLNDMESRRRPGGEHLLSFSVSNENTNIRLEFVDMEGDPVLRIDDFRELGYEYLNHLGEGRFVRCSRCKRLVKRKSAKDHSTKYCVDCTAEKRRESDRNYRRKVRDMNGCR